MYTESHEDEFQAFLERNRSFWRENTGFPSHDGEILVDLTHDNPTYLLTNLFLAKYLQRLRGGRVLGLAKNWRKALPHYDFGKIERLAESFLVDRVINLDVEADAATVEQAGRRFQNHVRGLHGSQLRRAVLCFEWENDPDVGWVLYDTHLRGERRATFEEVDEALENCAWELLASRDAINRCLTGRRVTAAVVGHYHYSPYAFMALAALRRQAPVFFQSLLVPFSVKRFATADDMRHGRAADFMDAYERDVVSGVTAKAALLDRFRRRFQTIQGGAREFFRVLPAGSRIDSRRQFLTELGLNPILPAVCIYSPALCGAPHAYGPLFFEDFAHWLNITLKIAAATPGVNFMLKPHPLDDVYDTSGYMHTLMRQYGDLPNVRFLKADMASQAIVQHCDLAVTVSGTPGYELPLRGVATVAAGPGRYAGLGIAREISTLGEYQSILQDPLGQTPLSEDGRHRAAVFGFFELAAGRSHSIFIPPPRKAGTAEFWAEATHAVDARWIEEDPLYRNFRYMAENDNPFLINTDLLAAGRAPAGSVQDASIEAALRGLHDVSLTAVRCLERELSAARQTGLQLRAERDTAVAERAFTVARFHQLLAEWCSRGQLLCFGVGQTGNAALGEGWSVPEPNGVWTDGSHATIRLPRLAFEQGMLLTLAGHGFTSEGSPARTVHIAVNGVALASRTYRHQEVEPRGWTVHVSAPVAKARDGIEIEFAIINPAPVASVPGSERRLGLWLASLQLRPAETACG